MAAGRLLAGFALAVVTAELALRLFPVSTGYSFLAVNVDEPILRGTPHVHYVYSKNWNFRLRNAGFLNNYGFRASYDYVRDPRALVIVGNSYVQADAITPSGNMTEQLGRLLARPAYAVGVDGFSLADYLVAARWAAAAFWPRSAPALAPALAPAPTSASARTSAPAPAPALARVPADGNSHLLLALLTTGDLDHSCAPRAGEHYLEWRGGRLSLALVPRPSPSRLKRWINDSMLFRYLFDNLHAEANWTRERRAARAAGGEGAEGGEGGEGGGAGEGDASPRARGCATPQFLAAATQFLLAGFRELEGSSEARVVFVLAPGYRREQSYAPGATRDVDVFAKQAEAEGFQVVRLQDPFLAALRAGTRLDFVPIDAHWNATANALAARAIAASLTVPAGRESSVTAAR